MTDDDDHEEITWQKKPLSFLGPGVDWWHDANVGWVQSRKNFFGYVEGYRRAAVTLFESLEHTRQSPEYMVWPLAFLWRHFIELSLKDIIATGRLLQGDEWRFPVHHRLGKLWKKARKVISEVPLDEFKHVEASIREFEKLDPTASGFRYPLGKNGVDASLKPVEQYVNLRSLHEAMVKIADFFDGVRLGMSVRLDQMGDADGL